MISLESGSVRWIIVFFHIYHGKTERIRYCFVTSITITATNMIGTITQVILVNTEYVDSDVTVITGLYMWYNTHNISKTETITPAPIRMVSDILICNF